MAFFATPNTSVIIIAAVVAAAIVIGIIADVVSSRRRKKKQAEEQLQTRVEQGVRQKLMEMRNEYLVMARGETYTVGVNGQIAPGKYLLKNSVEGGGDFNLRYNGFAQPYPDGTVLTLGAGDSLCALSASVLIKLCVEEAATAE